MPKYANLHVGCGDVYLKGYLNCDITGERSMDVSPALNETTVDHYFRYPFGTSPRPFIVDIKMNALEKWPFHDGSAQEVVTISFIEHFTPRQAQFIASEVQRILKSGGRWVVDFPDIEETIQQYILVDPDFCMRLIYCNHKNEQSIHKWGYTKKTFKTMLKEMGNWRSIRNEIVVKHDYPMTGMIAIKA